MIGSRSLPSSLKVGSLTHTFMANSNCRTRLAQPMNAAIPRSIAVLGRALGQRRPVGAAAPDHPAALMFSAVSRGFIRRMCAPDRAGVALGVHLAVVEVVVPLHVGAERRIVLLGREHERRAAAPAAHELGGDELLLLRRLPPCVRRNSRNVPTCSCIRR